MYRDIAIARFVGSLSMHMSSDSWASGRMRTSGGRAGCSGWQYHDSHRLHRTSRVSLRHFSDYHTFQVSLPCVPPQERVKQKFNFSSSITLRGGGEKGREISLPTLRRKHFWLTQKFDAYPNCTWKDSSQLPQAHGVLQPTSCMWLDLYYALIRGYRNLERAPMYEV